MLGAMLLASRCAGCGRPGGSPCPSCHAQMRPPAPEPDPPGLLGLVVLVRYEGRARDVVARVKYRNERRAVAWLADGLASLVAAAGQAVDVVSWAPTTRSHRRARGFDHGEVLARAVARRLGVPAVGLLRRTDDTAQTGRPAAARRDRAPAFVPVRPVAEGTRVLLVDDVVTTGATLAAAARALRRGGAHVVPAAAARTPSPQAAHQPA